MRTSRLLVGIVPFVLGAAACSGGSSAATSDPASVLRLGYFANVTHAPALVGVDKGYFSRSLGSTKLKTEVFNAGPDEMTALESGSIDAAFVGPSPAVNAFVKSAGKALRIVAGAASGGAELVVKPSITTAAQLTGKKIADPQLGNTQDVALRVWLNHNGHHVSLNSGDVTIQSQDNSTTVSEFQTGQIDGAWVPEPYASELVAAGGHVLVNEKSLWPDGRFATTVLVVATPYLTAHPAQVKALITGELDAITHITADPEDSKAAINAELAKLSGKPLKTPILDSAFADVTSTYDPVASSLQTEFSHALAAGTVTSKASLKGLVDLTDLNQVLAARGKPPVSDGGLG